MTDNYDPVTGEVLSPPEHRALDGAFIPGAALTAGSFIDLLEDGEFSQDLHEKLHSLGLRLDEISDATGQKAKGKITITIDLTREDNAFRVASKMKVDTPEMPRQRTILWQDQDGNFTRFPPNQVQMFGLRSVGAANVPARAV